MFRDEKSIGEGGMTGKRVVVSLLTLDSNLFPAQLPNIVGRRR